MTDTNPPSDELLKRVVEIARGPWAEHEIRACDLAQETGTNATEILNLIKAALQTLGQEEPAETLPAKDYIHRNRPDGILYDLSHDGAALELGREAGFDHAARYVKAWGQWLMWDGARWEPDEKLLHMTLIRQHLRNKAEAILLHAFERRERAVENGSESAITEAEKHLDVARKVELRLRDKAFVSAVAEFARSNPASAAAPSAFDKDPDVLGTPSGYVCLKSGKLEPADPKANITKITGTTPAAMGTKPTRWLKFLDEVFGTGSPIIGFMQRVLGYALTGHTSEEIILFLYGTGRNGKGTMTETITYILGDYVRQIAPSTLLYTQQKEHSTEIAGLAGARVILGSELPAGKYWDEQVIKQLTGGDTITARYMRQDFFDFKPEFLPIMSGNSKPRIRDVDPAYEPLTHGAFRPLIPRHSPRQQPEGNPAKRGPRHTALDAGRRGEVVRRRFAGAARSAGTHQGLF